MSSNTRPVTLFTGQWADLSIDEMAKLAKEMGYDGLELACWGQQFDVDAALDPVSGEDYCNRVWQTLQNHGISCYALSNHLAGQGVCDSASPRLRSILTPKLWGDGITENINKRCAQAMIDTGRAARRFMDLKPSGYGPSPDWGRHTVVVNGFTGSPVWDAIYAFPPATQDFFEEGYGRFADQWLPILEEFDQEDVVFGLEVHPTEIAFDTVTMRRALEALAYHERFKINYDPSHLGWQRVNYVSFLLEFSDRIAHVHMKDAAWGLGNGESGVNGSHLDFGSPGRWWDFKSVGRGMIDFTAIIEVLNAIGYRGPLSVEWEHAGMDRVFGATEACTKVRELDFPISEVAFDAAMAEQGEAANA